MRLGLLEIVIILIIIILILVVTRTVRSRPNSTNEGQTSSYALLEQVAEKRAKVLQRLRAVGLILIVIGIVSLLAGISLFKWVYWSFLWAFIAIAIGLVMVLLSIKSRKY